MSSTSILQALHFAANKHRAQRRKDADSSPYINHPIAVAELLGRVGMVTDPVVLLAAILHDTIEDTDTSPAELEEHFGAEVRHVVDELTDDKSQEKDERKRAQIQHAARSSSRAKLVKLADKICNVLDVTDHPPADWSTERRVAYLEWSEQVVAGCRGTNTALERYFDDAIARGQATFGSERDARL